MSTKRAGILFRAGTYSPCFIAQVLLFSKSALPSLVMSIERFTPSMLAITIPNGVHYNSCFRSSSSPASGMDGFVPPRRSDQRLSLPHKRRSMSRAEAIPLLQEIHTCRQALRQLREMFQWISLALARRSECPFKSVTMVPMPVQPVMRTKITVTTAMASGIPVVIPRLNPRRSSHLIPFPTW